jgi:hypothetical protein
VNYLTIRDKNRCAVRRVVLPNGGGISLAPIDRDLRRHPMLANRLGEKPLGGALVPLFRQQKVDGLAHPIDGAIQVPPLTFHADVGLVHAPAAIHRSLPTLKGRFELWAVLQHPAVDGRVIDGHSTLLHELFDLAIAQGVRHVPPDAGEDDVLREMGPLETDHHRSPSLTLN